MANLSQLLKEGRTQEIWEKYCGYIDLSLQEFMEIQKRLLMEQIHLLADCELGRRIMGGKVPTSVEEFRQTVPLTTYEDYIPFLSEKREDVLPAKPVYWLRTSGRSGEYPFKWAPISKLMFEDGTRYAVASVIFATCSGRGDIAFKEGDTFLYCMAPLPYPSGMMAVGLEREVAFTYMPPLEQGDKMSFSERIAEGFKLAFRDGLDIFFGLTSVLLKVAEAFSEQAGTMKPSLALLHPVTLSRLLRGLVKSKLAKRPMLPKDLWTVKGVVCAGMDTTIYRDKIKYYWGKYPLEMYGGTEFTLMAQQTWDYEGMTFVPDMNFLEFIPEEEHIKAKSNPTYRPRTVLLEEVKTGEKYEIVITNLKGGAYIRYRPGDMIRITALRNEKLNIALPQMVFEARCDDIIDIAGFTRLTETVLWQAIEKSGIAYEDWVARKEIVNQQPMLNLYIELLEDDRAAEIAEAIHHELKALDADYNNLEEMLGLRPLRVTPLPLGAFQRYFDEQIARGVEPAHYKPRHINPSDEVIQRLLHD